MFPTSALICWVEFRSLKVAVLVFTVSKSTVIPNGIPIASVRAYLRPMEPLLSSTLWDKLYCFRLVTSVCVCVCDIRYMAMNN